MEGTRYESLSGETLLFSPSVSAWFYFHRLLLSGPQGSRFWQHWKEEIKMKSQSVREMFWWVCVFLFDQLPFFWTMVFFFSQEFNFTFSTEMCSSCRYWYWEGIFYKENLTMFFGHLFDKLFTLCYTRIKKLHSKLSYTNHCIDLKEGFNVRSWNAALL